MVEPKFIGIPNSSRRSKENNGFWVYGVNVMHIKEPMMQLVNNVQSSLIASFLSS